MLLLTSTLTNQTAQLIMLEAHWTGLVTWQLRAFLTAAGVTAMFVLSDERT